MTTNSVSKAKSVLKIQDWKKNQNLALTTCYDAWSAKIIAESTIDAVLVGDSAAMVMQGSDSTLDVSVSEMARYVKNVAVGLNKKKFLIGDMPFLSYRKGLKPAMDCVEALMQAGANAVKLEGLKGHEEIVEHIVGSGVPVMGHLGLTPQSVHGLGGYKVQGRTEKVATQLLEDALKLQDLGAFALVLECVPSQLAEKITNTLSIPTIGIGAGSACDGQVLVLHDLLGLSGHSFKFVRPFFDGKAMLLNALDNYSEAVHKKSFPNASESFE